MFGTIRKHQKWLWGVIITVTIISFVSFLSPNSRMNGGGRGGENYGSINGERVTRDQYLSAYREVDLNTFLMGGHWLSEEKKQSRIDPERETYQWLLLIQLQQKLGIHVSDDVAASMGQQLLRSFEKMGVTSPSIFIERVLQPHGVTIDDFERYIRHFVGIQELITTYGLSGRLVTPQEARALYDREHQEVATEAVFFSLSNYLADVSINSDTISEYYSNRIANYIIPERTQVSYVQFNVTNYLAQAETELSSNLTDLVESNVQRLGTNLFADAKTPEESKAKIREQLIRKQAMHDAQTSALAFANTLFDLKPFERGNLQKLAATNAIASAISAPFGLDDEPKDLKVGPDFTKAAFALTPDDPYAGPLPGDDGVYVISYNMRIPRVTPPLEQVRDRVIADYKHSQALMQAQLAGRTFYQTLTNSMAQGKTLDALSADAHLKTVNLPPFSISTRSLPDTEEPVSLNQLKQVAFSTMPGKISTFQPTPEGGFLLYVRSKLPVDESKIQTELPNFVASLRRTRQQEAFDGWFRKEVEKGLRDTPISQQRNPGTLSSAPAKS